MHNNVQIFTSSLYEMNSVIIEMPDAIVCFDLGITTIELERIKDIISSMGDKPIYHFLTHCDFDHIIGTQLFSRQTNIGFKYSGFQELLESKRKEWYDYYKTMPNSIHEPFDLIINVAIQKETSITIDSLDIQVFLTPGHTADGLSYYVEDFNLLIVGDMLSSCDIPIIEDSIEKYNKSLMKIKDIYDEKLPTIIPGHGKLILNEQQFISVYSRDMQYVNKIISETSHEVKIWLHNENLLSEDNINYHNSNKKR